jgi:hypothetical protein
MVTLNDPVFTEAATHLAIKMAEHAADPAEQIQYAYRRALLRPADDYRLQELLDFYREAEVHYQQHPELSEALLTEVAPEDPKLAALVNVANVILNLDELINK